MKILSTTALLLTVVATVAAGERGPGCPSDDQTPTPTPAPAPTPTTPTPTTPEPTTPTPTTPEPTTPTPTTSEPMTTTPTTSEPMIPTPTTPEPTTPAPPIDMTLRFVEARTQAFVEVKPVQWECYNIGPCFAGGRFGAGFDDTLYQTHHDQIYWLARFVDADCAPESESSIAILTGRPWVWKGDHTIQSFAVIPQTFNFSMITKPVNVCA